MSRKASKRAPLRQLTFGACIVGLDLEPLLRGELLAAMAAVLLRPCQACDTGATAEKSENAIPLDSFAWPKVGPAVVHFPWGGGGPCVEHPPGIVCDECQWRKDSDGWPLPSCGRESQRVCHGCRKLRTRRQWCAVGVALCSECAAAVFASAGWVPRSCSAGEGDTGAAP